MSGPEVVDGVRDLSKPESSERLVQAALGRFGHVDSATAFTGPAEEERARYEEIG